MYRRRRRLAAWAATSLIFGALPVGAVAQPESVPALHIDVPVTLERANVVFDVGHAVDNGDALFFVGDLGILLNDVSKVDGHVVAVFHGDAAYVVLDDVTYDAVRRVTTGNPFAKQVAAWQSRGVQVELCGATAAGNHWTNANLLPGVKVNTDAMARVTQLEQQGYTLIYE